jgi:L-threonylcarbamoyladenylate synthase
MVLRGNFRESIFGELAQVAFGVRKGFVLRRIALRQLTRHWIRSCRSHGRVRISLQSATSAADALARAVNALQRGLVVGFPTDTVYALAVDPYNPVAVDRLFAIKQRDRGKPVPLIAGDMRQVEDSFIVQSAVQRLASVFWPGPLTILVDAPAVLHPSVDGGTWKVGVRVPDNVVARELALRLGRPITATSANISGEAPLNDPAEIERQLGDFVALTLDVGLLSCPAVSTIVDVSTDPPRLVRSGAIAFDQVLAVLGRYTQEAPPLGTLH